MSAAGLIRELRRPPTTAAVRWKIQNGGGDKLNPSAAQVVTYVDSRYVADRLNQVMGFGWSDTYRLVYDEAQGGLLGVECTISVDGVAERRDVGYFAPGKPEMHLKGLYSDAFKRAGVKLGIGAVLYTVPLSFVDGNKGEIKYGGKLSKPVGFTPAGQKKLDAVYTRHLIAVQHIFGEPLDHGDAAGAQGDVEVGDTPPEEPEAVSEAPEHPAVRDQVLYSDVIALYVAKSGKSVEESVVWVDENCTTDRKLRRALEELEKKPDAKVAA